MAQDMGDDIGERIFRLLGRAVGYGVRRFLADYQRNAEQWTRQRFIENGMPHGELEQFIQRKEETA